MCGTTHRPNNLALLPDAGPTLLWDGISFFKQHLLQIIKSKLIPRVFNEDEVRTYGRTFHPLHSQILEVVSDKPRSVRVSFMLEERVRIVIGRRISSEYVLYIKNGSNDIEPCFSSEGDVLQMSHCLHKKMFSISAAISIMFSMSTYTFYPPSNCRRQNLDPSLNITFLHMFRFQCTCCHH